MMECFNIDNYLEKLILRCKESFGDRLFYVGLQGSYLRGDATENSDIDVMIVLDGFSVEEWWRRKKPQQTSRKLQAVVLCNSESSLS